MDFVQINRHFVPLKKDEELNVEIGRLWGYGRADWLDWAALVTKRRVILLAEAQSGKSAEFRAQADALTNEGHAAFIVSIEDLADDGLEDSLDAAGVAVFQSWCVGGAPGWFFLDSIDEARLNSKSLNRALRNFGRELAQAGERAHVYISCRVSDWRGSADRQVIERLLPAYEVPIAPEADADQVARLLAPVFDKKQKQNLQTPVVTKATELLILRLAPLVTDQCRLLAAAAGVQDVAAFIWEIQRSGLDAYTDRPGDLLELAEYWNDHRRTTMSASSRRSLSRIICGTVSVSLTLMLVGRRRGPSEWTSKREQWTAW
jgi:hypothetical protein